jgi:hypothetical protein
LAFAFTKACTFDALKKQGANVTMSEKYTETTELFRSLKNKFKYAMTPKAIARISFIVMLFDGLGLFLAVALSLYMRQTPFDL